MRDFFYNKGDVLITILIILVATAVIYFRVGVIMNYPSDGDGGRNLIPSLGLFAQNGEQGQGQANAVNDRDAEQESENQPPAKTETPEQGQPAQASAQNPGDDVSSQEPPTETDPPEPAQPDPPQNTQITVNAGDAASTIADKLVAAGAIADKQAFLSEVMAQGADAKLKMGTFTIPAGATIAEIIKILVG